MATKKKKKQLIHKKEKKRITLFFLIFGAIIIYLSLNFISNVSKIITIKKEKRELNNNLSELKKEENVLNSDMKKLKDPEYIARYAREKYFYSKEGEIIIRFPDDREDKEKNH